MLAATGEAILSNEQRYGADLDLSTIGMARARLTIELLQNRLSVDRVEPLAPKPEVKEPRPRHKPAPKQQEGKASAISANGPLTMSYPLPGLFAHE